MKAAEARITADEANKPVNVTEHLGKIHEFIALEAREGRYNFACLISSFHFANLATRSEVIRSLEREGYTVTIKAEFLAVEW